MSVSAPRRPGPHGLVGPDGLVVTRGPRPSDPTGGRGLPLSGATEHLVPDRVLPGGWAVEVGGGPGATSLALALAAGPADAGAWVACVGLPQLGWEAAEEVGLPLDRIVAVRTTDRQWPTVVAALLDAVDLVVCGPEVVPAAGVTRRLRARARERGSVLVSVRPGVPSHGVAPRSWPELDARFRVQECRWRGLGTGWGHLGHRVLVVSVEGRGALSRPRRHEVHFGPGGRPEASGPAVPQAVPEVVPQVAPEVAAPPASEVVPARWGRAG